MKRVVAAAALVGVLALPGLARAGSSTDAALALGAFAVFNQVLSGTGIFGAVREPVVVAAPPPPPVYTPAPPPAVYAPAPSVVYAPAPPVYAPAPPPQVVYAPAPPPEVVYMPAPAPVVVQPAPPTVIYRSPGVVYRPAGHGPWHGRPYWR